MSIFYRTTRKLYQAAKIRISNCIDANITVTVDPSVSPGHVEVEQRIQRGTLNVPVTTNGDMLEIANPVQHGSGGAFATGHGSVAISGGTIHGSISTGYRGDQPKEQIPDYPAFVEGRPYCRDTGSRNDIVLRVAPGTLNATT